MKSEYVKLSGSEMLYGKKHLLQSQLEFLKIFKAFRNFKQLRAEEFKLKFVLKSKIDETRDMIAKFESLLPKTEYKFNREFKRKEKEAGKDDSSLSLQEEIDFIKRKLERLQQEI